MKYTIQPEKLNLKCFMEGHDWKQIGPDHYICKRCGRVKIKGKKRLLKNKHKQ